MRSDLTWDPDVDVRVQTGPDLDTYIRIQTDPGLDIYIGVQSGRRERRARLYSATNVTSDGGRDSGER